MTLAIAYILDLIFGDPYYWPHPVSAMGKAIKFGERQLNKGSLRFLKGMLLSLLLIVLTAFFTWSVLELTQRIHPYAFYALETLGIYFCLANQCLIKEGKAVWDALERGLEQGRKRLSWIVGRETQQLNGQQIRTATLETMAENLSDGVVAPLFWLAVGGLPAMMAYKMVNTLDSMIGYKNERYLKFGKFAARFDDLLNLIPARMTGILIAVSNASFKSVKFMFQFGKAHSSPNAAYPEAALAGVLNVRFGGPNYYHGQLVEKAFIGENEKLLENKDLKRTIRTNHLVTFLMVLIILSVQYLERILNFIA